MELLDALCVTNFKSWFGINPWCIEWSEYTLLTAQQWEMKEISMSYDEGNVYELWWWEWVLGVWVMMREMAMSYNEGNGKNRIECHEFTSSYN